MGIISPVARVVVVGGDERFSLLPVRGADVQTFPSVRYSRNGSLSRAKATIRGGAVDLVVLIVKWLGHADWDAVVKACASAHVPYLVVRGGQSAARRDLGAYLAKR